LLNSFLLSLPSQSSLFESFLAARVVQLVFGAENRETRISCVWESILGGFPDSDTVTDLDLN